ncbi:MAG: FHA domain-containing serine/threonine-protein kinase [Planctomycetota bacterium]
MRIPGLLLTEGPKKGVYLRLEEGQPFWLGRAETAHFMLDDIPTVSGMHCYLLWKGFSIDLVDESRNGTRLNGRKIRHERVALKNADIIRLGTMHFQIVDLDRSQKPSEYDFQTCLEDIEKRRHSQEPPELLEGIGPYLNIEVLGSGAFGVVYKSVHESLKKVVALKVSHENLESQFVKRFIREAQLLKKLQHSSIIQFYDEGIFEIEGEQRIYIALEYFQGINLRDHIRTHGRMPWQKVLKTLFQTLNALEYMHQLGILHRDMKPDNIMYNDVTEVAKIIDLGLGKSVIPEESSVSFTTQANATLGTPNFMPIEQWENVKEADERSDIYSLGATLYFLLSSELPFGKTKELEALYTAIIQQKLVPLDQLCSSEVPPFLLKIIHRMLALRPKNRYQKIADVIHDLASLVHHLTK